MSEGAEIDGKTLTVTSNTLLTTSGVDKEPLATNLAVHGAGDAQGEHETRQHSGWISFHPGKNSRNLAATEMRLTLTRPARAGQRVTLDYTGNQLKHSSDVVAPFGKLPVTNVTGAGEVPAPVRGSAAGNTLRLVFSRALAKESAPPHDQQRPVHHQLHEAHDESPAGG